MSAPRDGFRARLPRTAAGRAAAGLGALVLAFTAAVLVIDRLAPTPRGPDSSAYATAPAGLAAYADVLRRAGHDVERRRTPLTGRGPDPDGTLVVLDARGLPPAEARAIGTFVRAGGRLIAGGSLPSPWLDEALGSALSRRGATAGDERPLAPVPETAGVGVVRTVEGGAWFAAGSALPVLGDADAPLAVVVRSGRGRALLLADASPLQNRGLGAADNAAFGLAAAGPPSRPVIFLESVHGYGAATGLAALPAAARWALAGLLLAALAFAWSRARRIGPPEDEEEPLPPPRADYVDAIAGALVRTRRPGEVARPLREAGRASLARRAGLPGDAADDVLREAASRFGLTGPEADALMARGPAGGIDDALAAGRAHARLESHTIGAPGGRGEERR